MYCIYIQRLEFESNISNVVHVRINVVKHTAITFTYIA